MEKPKNYPKDFSAISIGYKVRICMESILDFISSDDKNITQYTLFQYWEHIQKKIDDE